MLARLRSSARRLVCRSALESDMELEMRFHIERYAEDLVRSGVPREEALRRARLSFGSLDGAKDDCRRAVGLRLWDEFRHNLRYGLRVLRRSPAFTITAVLTLALAIGANTAVFSVVDAVLLRALPYPEPDRLAQLVVTQRGRAEDAVQRSHPGRTWEAIRDQARYLDAAVDGGGSGVNFAVGNRVEHIRRQSVSAGFLRVLGVVPAMGREFTPEEDRPGGPAVAVLSDTIWKRLLGGDPQVLGRAVVLRGEPHVVVGVMPPGFRSTTPAELWTPLRPTPKEAGWNYGIVARLRPGASWGEAGAQVEALGAPLLKEFRIRGDRRMALEPLQRSQTAGVRRRLLVLWGAVGLVLLIGCINVAGLLLARAGGRTREIGTRMAIGGGRAAVVRQFLTESLLLAVLGGAVGIALGYLGVAGIRWLARENFYLWQDIRLDLRVLAASAAASLLTSMVFGLLPALETARVDVRSALIEGGARGVAGGARRWPRRLLVACEVALGVVLLVSAGLLIRTFAHLNGLRPGFDASNVITAKLSLDTRYDKAASVNRLYSETLARIRALPGVESAAVTLSLPYERALNVYLPEPNGNGKLTNLSYVTPEFFRTLRIPLLRGRELSEADGAASRPVVVVNEAFARAYGKGRDVLGTPMQSGKQPPEIVGVVGDVQQISGWGGFGPIGAAPEVFMPSAQMGDGDFRGAHTWFMPAFVVRTAGRQAGVVAGMERALHAVDPLLPFTAIRPLDEVRFRSLAQERLQAALLGALAGLALLMAAVGIYGLIANSVAERTREMGIRIALGSTLARAVCSVAFPGVALALAGVAAGVPLALAAVRVLKHLLWGVKPADPATFAAVALALLLVAAAASVVPALRLGRLNPAETLRQE